jgi:hypothetical protein
MALLEFLEFALLSASPAARRETPLSALAVG